jgi:hypothetical protein
VDFAIDQKSRDGLNLLLPSIHETVSLTSKAGSSCRTPNSELPSLEGDNDPRKGDTHLDSPKNIARLNIEHYRRLLAAGTDPAKRTTIEKLLAEEEAKVRALGGEGKSG